MEAIYLVKHGSGETAFERRALTLPPLQKNEVRIAVEGFGLNFADVMARNGLYREAPPLPAVLGYESVGRVDAIGDDVSELVVGQRVLAFSRFGGYATHVQVPALAVVPIAEKFALDEATALGTQYCTAWYAAEEALRMYAGEHVLIQAAAGGVGTALVQMAKRKGCIVYGTAGSEEKINYLRNLGVDHPINYRKENFDDYIRRVRPKGLDVVFDCLGGKGFKRGFNLLAPGGRIAGYGAAERIDKKGPFATLSLVFGFGFYNPVRLLIPSKTIAGVNMLRVAEQKPELLRRCMLAVTALAETGELKPFGGGIFEVSDIGKAHELLQNRQTKGKIAVRW
ncbi:MAG: quinone oxidoreductase family protein [Bacteroidia bacterium]